MWEICLKLKLKVKDEYLKKVIYHFMFVSLYIGSMIAATILTAIFCVVSLVRFMENHKYA
jgi:hypothetical protein